MNGLILIGGRSKRMGSDKSLIDYHGLPQREWLYRLLQPFCKQVFFSCRTDQIKEIADYQYIVDLEEDIGPLGGLRSAFQYDTSSAWFVVACDMPHITVETIKYLLQHRQPQSIATAFLNPATHLPEPLCTIWETRAAEQVNDALQRGNYSPTRLLQRPDVALIAPVDEQWLMNINSPQK
ncbi:MAG: molybdenum cofactor guanylyltransferase [Runella sp.]